VNVRSTFVPNGSFSLLVLAALSVAGVTACNGGKVEREPVKTGRIVARVNDSVLTEEELNDALPEFFGDLYSAGEKNDYVKQWLENELLYQKAIEEGLLEDEELQKKVSQFQHMLLEQEVLSRHFEGNITVTDDEVSEYYTENKEVFIRNEDEYRISKLIFQNEDVASEVVEELKVAPERFDELISSSEYDGMITLIDLGFYPVSGLSEAFGNQMDGFEIGGVSQIIVDLTGSCYVLRAEEYRKKGSIRDLSEVEDQIRSVLLRTEGEKAKQLWLEELRSEANIYIASEFVR
jgi:hypothetical protein